MSTGSPKVKKSGRISALFKRKSKQAAPEQTEQTTHPQNPIAPPYSDKERTRKRYLNAVSLLEDALNGRNEKWGNFEIPKLEGELEDVNPEEFRGKLEALCGSYSVRHDANWVGKCAHVLQCCFTASAPFAKNFLAIAKESAQVCAFKFTSTDPIDLDLESIRVALWWSPNSD
jgi:hypothetical protein